MKSQWKKTAAATVISLSLLASGYPVYADEASGTGTGQEQGTSEVQGEALQLTDNLQVVLKSLVNERTTDGIRVGAVVRMTNTSDQVERVPEYEVRVKTADGVEYTLQSSAANAKSVQPRTTIELSYLAVLDRSDSVELSELSWVDVDEYVYPKTETTMLTVPVASKSWEGSDSSIEDPAALKKWGESFTIPYEDSPLVFTTSDLSMTPGAQGPVELVKVLVKNPTDQRRPIPDFSLDGKTADKSFAGKRVEPGPLYVEPGDEQYIHFAIPIDADAKLASLNVMTPESFVQAAQGAQGAQGGQGGTPISYTVGRLNILLPQVNPADSQNGLPDYTFGDPIVFDSHSSLIDPSLTVSLADLRLYKNDGKGYVTAVAKFKLANNGDTPLALPGFTAELDSTDGYSYTSGGANVGTTAQPGSKTVLLAPKTSSLVEHTFLLPESEAGNGRFTVKLLDAVTVAPYTSDIAAFNVSLLPEMLNRDPIPFYPFNVKIADWDYNGHISTGLTTSYSYWVKLNLDIQQADNVVLNQDISKMEVELVDKNGAPMSSQLVPFVGQGKLINGWQTIYFNNVGSQLESGVTINIYEAVNTAEGTVKRLVAQFHP